jgi:hypothetical protein
MKITRLLMVFVLFATLFSLAAAQVPKGNKFKLGEFPSWSFPDIDSGKTSEGDAFDCSLFSGKQMYYAFKFAGGTDDSVRIIIMSQFNSVLFDMAIDTVIAKAGVTYLMQASNPVLTGYLIYPRVIPIDNLNASGTFASNKTLEFAIFAVENANINSRRSWWDKY